MTIFFKDAKDQIYFEYSGEVPGKTSKKYKTNLTLLQCYQLYKNSIYSSCVKKADITQDILEYPSQFKLANKQPLNRNLHIYHYTVAGALEAMKDWKDPTKNVRAYIAYETFKDQNQEEQKKMVGFLHFNENEIAGKKFVYIAHAGVVKPGQHIGTRLMECVLAHYPAGTEFYICTRTFNIEAKGLYEKRLGFVPIDGKESKLFMDVDKEYVGFKKTTTLNEVESIKRNQANKAPERASSMRI